MKVRIEVFLQNFVEIGKKVDKFAKELNCLPRLSAFLRGELTKNIVPDFCDISMFKTIVNQALKNPTKELTEKQSYLKSLKVIFLIFFFLYF